MERRIPFNSLPTGIRSRLVDVFKGEGNPEPILADRSSLGWAIAGWGTLATLGAGLVGVLAWWDFGRFSREMAVQGPFIGALYVGGAFLFVWGLLRIAHRVRLGQTLPFPPGRYLLPLDFVDATSDVLRIIPRADLIDFNGVHHHTNGAYTHTELSFVFPGGTETFSVSGQGRAEALLDHLRVVAGLIAEAARNDDLATLMVYDPFLELRMGDLWDATAASPAVAKEGPGATPLPLFLTKHLPVAALCGVVIGPAVLVARNIASDEIMFADIVEATDTWEVHEYIENGWLHVEEARSEVLPGVGFRSAREQRSVGAMRAFLNENPGSKYEAEGRAVIHELYTESLDAFREKAATGDPAMMPFMEALLPWLETHDSPAVQVRFLPPSSDLLAGVDKELALDGGTLDGLSIAPVAGYFDEKHNRAREGAITTTLQQGFATVFPNDVLRLETGDPLTAADLEADVKVPTMEVAYAVGTSGEIYQSDTSQRLFVGIAVAFDVTMRIPGEEETIVLELDVEPPPVFEVGGMSLWMDVNSPVSDGSVYDVMALRAFDQLATKTAAVFFRDPLAPPPPVQEPSWDGIGGF